ncbi:TolC family protein [candidate division KSB1 bacterium]|nr:TolC family protein [candidate division KSB1 bacterium]
MKNAPFQILLILCASSAIVAGQTLEDYLRIAAENNPGLQARHKSYKAALQHVSQVNSLADPTFSFGYFLSPVETRVGPQRARLSLSQMFPWFGTLKARGDAAALSAQAEFQVFIQARNKLYYQVASAYYPLYELGGTRKIEEQNIDILESFKTLALENFRNGTGSLVDVLQVDILLREAESNLKILELKEKPLRSAFNQLLNRASDEPVTIADTVAVPIFDAHPELFENHPTLQELNYRIESAVKAERVAAKNGLPRLGVGLDYVIISERGDMSSAENGKDVVMPMISISLPLYRKPYRAAQEEARMRQQAYRLQKQQARNTLEADVEMAAFEIERHLELLALYERQIAESRDALDLLLTAYGNSGKEFDQVLHMRQQLLNYEKMRIASISQGSVAVEKIKYLTAQRSLDEIID